MDFKASCTIESVQFDNFESKIFLAQTSFPIVLSVTDSPTRQTPVYML